MSNRISVDHTGKEDNPSSPQITLYFVLKEVVSPSVLKSSMFNFIENSVLDFKWSSSGDFLQQLPSKLAKASTEKRKNRKKKNKLGSVSEL